jgi:hypothetical protein
MTSFLDRVCDQLNLRWAWEKVQKASVPGDVWVDESALAAFDMRLGEELASIASDLKSMQYRITPLRPMAFPKNADAEGNARVRQYFHIALRDQVAWVAVVNVLGPYIDSQMPPWSYGNRLFRSTWIDDIGQQKIRRVGPYRHSSGRIYRPFHQSWPIFRRHISLAVNAAANPIENTENLDQDELDELGIQSNLSVKLRCPFVRPDYWAEKSEGTRQRDVYWASVDLEKFYPSISISECIDRIIEHIPEEMKGMVSDLLSLLTTFPVNTLDWASRDLELIELSKTQKRLECIPTGLLVSGFLSNAALLKVDLEVERLLPKGKVAHFRYVDDHVILAKSFEDLVEWISRYKSILEEHGCGGRINAAKTEPAALGLFFNGSDVDSKGSNGVWPESDAAKTACKLDPDFPTPLMTKTIALVSAIGKTDFSILESDELGTLTHQLEHLLLVDIPDEEMPARTRLAFAATRLAKIAESRLASPDLIGGLPIRNSNAVSSQDGRTPLGPEKKLDPMEELLGESSKELHRRLEGIANRVFALIRRVLRERPDRVRLWTHALVIARRLGSTGLIQFFDDIKTYGKHPVNRLASWYVLGNSYAVLSAEAVRATQILVDRGTAGWRRAASLRFLRSLADFSNDIQPNSQNTWFVQKSFDQFCVGLYCVAWLLRNSGISAHQFNIRLDEDLVKRGAILLSSKETPPSARISLAWWACRFEMRDAISAATPLINHLGMLISDLAESRDFWAFFPSSTPMHVLERMLSDKKALRFGPRRDGWWLDALHNRAGIDESIILRNTQTAKVVRSLATDGRHLPLPLWVERARHGSNNDGDCWRIGEWTCLEIVRQSANLLSSETGLDEKYIKKVRQGNSPEGPLCAHPMNFLLPVDLLDVPVKSWEDWRARLGTSKGGVVKISPERTRLFDSRYAPLLEGSASFWQNQVRGLGLCLYGLLSRSFALPTQWNGYGHQDVLRYLAQLLRSKITYSSATLGLLDACLQPRASENLFSLQTGAWLSPSDDDTSGDPIRLIDATGLAAAIARVQSDLARNQLSTFNNHARQITPVSLMHLTDTNWKSYFGEAE